MHSAQNFGANNFAMTTFFWIGIEFGIFHEKGRRESLETVPFWIAIRSVPNRSVPDRNSFRSDPFHSVPDRNPFRSEPFRAAISIEKPFRSVPGTSLI